MPTIIARSKAHKRRGFTLIELIIVILVVSVMLTLATPGFQKFIIEARTKEAVLIALKDSQFMERFYTVHGKYTLGKAWPPLPHPVSPEQGEPLYKITVSPATYTAANDYEYRIQARPVCNTLVADNGCVCIDQDGNVYLHQAKLCLNAPKKCSCRD